jgi:hypothetical protein
MERAALQLIGAALTLACLCGAARAGVLCHAEPAIQRSGSVVFDGETFTDPGALRMRLFAYRRLHSDCAMSPIADRDADPRVVARVTAILRQVGFAR